MKRVFTLIIAFLFCLFLNAEVRIHMEKEGGVYKVPCKVNGLKMKFIFDTGAAKVCISSAYAEMMLENGYLDKSDIKGTSKSTIADGRVIDNVVINLRKVEIAGLTIENVPAVVVPTQNAPLLLGQSVIQKLGRVSIDGEDLVIHNANIYTEEEIESLFQKANNLYTDGIFGEALKYFKLVYEYEGDNINPWVLFKMGVCYHNIGDKDSSIKCHLKAIELDDGDNEDNILYEAYLKLAAIVRLKGDYSKALEYAKLMLKYTTNDSERTEAFWSIGTTDYSLEKYNEGLAYFDKSIKTLKLILKKRKLTIDEAWTYAQSYFESGLCLESLYRFQEAIDAYTTGRTIAEKYKNEDFYNDLINDINKGLSRCYNKLVK